MNGEHKILTWIAGIWCIVGSFFAPIRLLLYAIAGLVILDTFTAILKRWKDIGKSKLGRRARLMMYWKAIESSGIRRTFVKLLLYGLGVMAFYLAEVAVFTTSIYISNLAGALILFTELKSICENMDVVLGTNTFTRIFRRVRKKVENKLDNKINDN